MTAGSIARFERLTRSTLAFGGLTAMLVLSGSQPALAQAGSHVALAGSLVIAMGHAGRNGIDFTASAGRMATPDLTVEKAVGGTLQEEHIGIYTISVTNSGSLATVEALTVVDTLPAGVTHVATAGVGWAIVVTGQVVTALHPLTLDAGAVASFSITVKFGAAAVGTVTNRAHVSGGGEINTSNNTATNVATIAGRPNISLLKSVNGATAIPGALLQYTLTFRNQGTAPAANVMLVDPLPPQVLFAVNSVETILPTGINAVVEYSRDSAINWDYTPLTAGCGAPTGFDGCVTHLRWRLLNPLDAAEGSNSGTLRFSTRVK